MWGIWFSCKRETDRWEKVARVREVERRGEWKQNNLHYPSFLFNNGFAEHFLTVYLEHSQLLKVFSFCDLTLSPPDDSGEWEHTMCQSACKWSCTSLKVLVPEPSQKGRSSTPLPHSRAFDLHRPETMSFVFILHLGCGLLFSEIIEINSEFEGEAERSHSVQLVVLGFAFFPSKTIKLSWWN